MRRRWKKKLNSTGPGARNERWRRQIDDFSVSGSRPRLNNGEPKNSRTALVRCMARNVLPSTRHAAAARKRCDDTRSCATRWNGSVPGWEKRSSSRRTDDVAGFMRLSRGIDGRKTIPTIDRRPNLPPGACTENALNTVRRRDRCDGMNNIQWYGPPAWRRECSIREVSTAVHAIVTTIVYLSRTREHRDICNLLWTNSYDLYLYDMF